MKGVKGGGMYVEWVKGRLVAGSCVLYKPVKGSVPS